MAAIAANAARYDAVKRGAPPDGDLITLAEVAERDGWICQLCGEPVDPALRSPDPGSGSIDHIIPLALHGPHRWSNVQLAHRTCNSRKGKRVTPS